MDYDNIQNYWARPASGTRDKHCFENSLEKEKEKQNENEFHRVRDGGGSSPPQAGTIAESPTRGQRIVSATGNRRSEGHAKKESENERGCDEIG